MEICPKCGLPLQACVCEQIGKSTQRIQVSTVKRRYGKITTQISGFDKNVDLKKIAKALKNELACGGTIKDNAIELQGNHKGKIKELLVKQGFDSNSIEN